MYGILLIEKFCFVFIYANLNIFLFRLKIIKIQNFSQVLKFL